MSRYFLQFFVLAVMPSIAHGVVLTESHSMRDYVKTLRDAALDDIDPGNYVAPTSQQRADFATMVMHLTTGNLAAADAIASGLGYEVVNLTDTDMGGTYYHLREVTVSGKVTRGWGSYFYNPGHTQTVLIEAPHILHDTYSYDVATVALIHSGAMGMMLNGAHRDSGGAANSDVADVAHLADSIFNTVHQTWSTSAAIQAWQIHGFDLDNHGSIPAGTDVVLSNGDGSVSQEIINLDTTLESVGFLNDAQSIVHVYNTLDVNDPINQQVNGAVDGTDMSGLGATTNVQGIFTRGQGGTFVHIELEKSIRLDGTLSEDEQNRETAGIAIADAITLVPEPSSALFIGLTMICGLIKRRR